MHGHDELGETPAMFDDGLVGAAEDEEMMDGMMLARGRCPHNTRCVEYAS